MNLQVGVRLNPRVRSFPPAWAPLRTLGLFLVVAGCGHSDPFSSPPAGTDQPFDPTPPVRVTLNSLADRGASWLPDGSGILYSAQQLGRADHDVCLALLPPTGGRQLALTCDRSPAGADSVNAFESPTTAADGRLAFISASGPPMAAAPISEAIEVAPTLDPRGASKVRTLPYTIPGEPLHNHAMGLRWLGTDRLTFIGGVIAFPGVCSGCPIDTVFAGLKVVTLDAVAGGSPVAIGGTDFASSVSEGSSQDEIYYTIGGDSRVYRRTLSTGEVVVAYDFGSAGIVRDVQVVGGTKLTAVVGGRVGFGIDPVLGPTQRDSGGVVHVVQLGTGTDQPLDQPGLLFRRPALSPDGTHIVAEGYTLAIFDNGTVADTTVNKNGDLYLLGAP